MNLQSPILEVAPLVATFGAALVSSLSGVGKRWQDVTLGLLGALFLCFAALFLTDEFSGVAHGHSLFDVRYNKISVFVGLLYCGSLFVGLYPIRRTINLSSEFLFYLAGGLGIILANNLPTFFLFWAFQRALPLRGFLRDGTGGTYVFQHFLTAACFLFLLGIAASNGLLIVPMREMPASFFTWPVLILSFVIVYESHGIFPFHSWVHDVVGRLLWYEFSALFLARAGVLLFVQLLLPTLAYNPDLFKILLLSLSIVSSVYWSLRGILEGNLAKKTTYFYIAQASLLLTGMQADLTAAKGSYLHLMVISVAGTALFSILSFVNYAFSFKRRSPYYGMAIYFPTLATLFCLFGFCVIGVPLGASFVVEDLVITGLLEYHPYLGLGHIVATALNGIFFFLIFTKIFLGPSPYPEAPDSRDMSLGQMTPYLLAFLLLLMIGVMPSLFLERITW
jgi:formate hydrogenlyase subunit 3/multisubunit Na+/H+ antiporter MnhD subunit